MAVKMTEPYLNVKSPQPALDAAIVVACAVLWAAKFWLATRININWDEFYFLTHVHAAARGELTLGLQTAFAHLFTGLLHVPGMEAEQVVAARLAMALLLGLGAWLVYRLAASRYARTDALLAALAFLALWPTLRHGAAFRYDSMLLPLQLGALVLLAGPGPRAPRRAVAAGVLLGLAATVSIKAALIGPVVLAFGWLGAREQATSAASAVRPWLVETAWIGGVAAATAGLLLGAHWLTLDAAAVASASAQAGDAWTKTILQTTLFPRLYVLKEMAQADPALWSLIALGALVAAVRRQWHALACLLALLPVVFYRNSFAYFYVVMCAPAAMLVATATAQIRSFVHARVSARAAGWFGGALASVMALQATAHVITLAEPRQREQRAVIAAVHAIFPRPVAYIDRCGMVASFRKANFFMSSWGIEQYLASGAGFMRAAIETQRAPLLLANREELRTGSPAFARLRVEDRASIECCYVAYWGPVSIAGSRTVLRDDRPQRLRLPFGGAYRLDSPVALQVDGRLRQPGEVVEVDDSRREAAVQRIDAQGPEVTVRLLWAEARPPPRTPPPLDDLLFDPL